MGLLVFNEIKNQTARWIRKLRVRTCPVPFVIWFRERSGSSHLCSVLNSHPEIVCRREDFHEVNVDQFPSVPTNVEVINIRNDLFCYRRMVNFQSVMTDSPTSKQVISHLHDIFSCPLRACGLKLKFPTQHQLFPEVFRELESFGPKLRIIALSRRNVLKQAVSRQNMLRISQGTSGSRFNLTNDVSPILIEKLKNERIVVDVKAAINYAQHLVLDKQGFENVTDEFETTSGCSVLRIDYEDLLADEPTVLKSILAHLDVNLDAPLISHVKKATPDQLSDAVGNYDELLAGVQNTELAPFLD